MNMHLFMNEIKPDCMYLVWTSLTRNDSESKKRIVTCKVPTFTCSTHNIVLIFISP